jgi:hypothetical protein
MRTCGEVILKRGAMQFCGDKAAFHYSGIVKIKGGETREHAIERRGRIEIDLCMGHSRERFIDMEPALKSGQATMRCLEFTKLTLQCTKCHSLFRFEPLKPVVVRGADEQSMSNGYFPIPNHFCPVCGNPAITEVNPELDYWEIIAGQLELPVSLTIEIYSHWLKDRTATNKFVEYIQALMKELDA